MCLPHPRGAQVWLNIGPHWAVSITIDPESHNVCLLQEMLRSYECLAVFVHARVACLFSSQLGELAAICVEQALLSSHARGQVF